MAIQRRIDYSYKRPVSSKEKKLKEREGNNREEKNKIKTIWHISVMLVTVLCVKTVSGEKIQMEDLYSNIENFRQIF